MADLTVNTRIWQDSQGLWRYTVHVKKPPANSRKQYGEGFSDDLSECLEEALTATRTHTQALRRGQDV